MQTDTTLRGLVIRDHVEIDNATHDGTTRATRQYVLTTEHAASSYGIPVLVDLETHTAYGPADRIPGSYHASAANLVRANDHEGLMEALGDQYVSASRLIEAFCG